SLAVELSESDQGRGFFARVKVPPSLPRLVPVPGSTGTRTDFLLLEELIEAHLLQLFPGMKIRGASAFRVTRDAEIEIREEEAGDLLRSVAENVRQRRFGAAIRLEVTPVARRAFANCCARSSSSMPMTFTKFRRSWAPRTSWPSSGWSGRT
ncbi:MAG TPA: hypothetical protein VLO07_09055, partial [Thermoanaerobaculia bacterium]|nr:hypothetical protein [Thermoanaerobaculia bacterium]